MLLPPMRSNKSHKSQESFRPRVTHLPDQFVATKMSTTPADYSLLVQQTILKVGLFRYKDYIRNP